MAGGTFSVKRCQSDLKAIDPPDDSKVTAKAIAYRAMNESERKSARVLWEQRLEEASGDERRKADSGSDMEITRIKVLYAVRAILSKCNGNLQEIQTLCKAIEKGEVPTEHRLLEIVGNATKDSDIGTLEFFKFLRKQFKFLRKQTETDSR